MATAIAESAITGEPVVEVLNRVAHDYGQRIGATKRPPTDAAAALELTVRVLSKYGYEPRRSTAPPDRKSSWRTARSTHWPRSRPSWPAT